MKYEIVHHFPGGTKAQYDAVLAAVHGPGTFDVHNLMP
jgi:hypothetical protein